MSTPLLSPYQFAIASHSLGHHASGRTLLGSALRQALTVEPQTLLQDLQRMNAHAYAVRYNKIVPQVEPATLPPDHEPLTPVQLIKCLQCIDYNCDCGEEMREKLAVLDKVQRALADHIVASLPEYYKAEWFIDSPSHTI